MNGIVFVLITTLVPNVKKKKNRVISFHITSATHQRIEYPNFEDVIPSAKWIYENLIVRKN